jgi:hypothetical protein
METRQYNAGSMIGGALLIVLGLIFLAFTQNLFGLEWSDVGSFWPFFPMLGGLFLIVPALAVRNSSARGSMVFAGSVPFLVGLFFLSITRGFFTWGDHETLWPVHPLIVGVSFLLGYAASGFKHVYFLAPGLIITTVALVFFAITLTASYDVLGTFWPLFLILAGLALLIPTARRAER